MFVFRGCGHRRARRPRPRGGARSPRRSKSSPRNRPVTWRSSSAARGRTGCEWSCRTPHPSGLTSYSPPAWSPPAHPAREASRAWGSVRPTTSRAPSARSDRHGRTVGSARLHQPINRSTSTVTVPVGQRVEIAIPAVCLNYGSPTPTPRDKFELMDVDDYSRDPRVRKALRSLATMGTSHGVAQAAMWHLCNGVPFETWDRQGESRQRTRGGIGCPLRRRGRRLSGFGAGRPYLPDREPRDRLCLG